MTSNLLVLSRVSSFSCMRLGSGITWRDHLFLMKEVSNDGRENCDQGQSAHHEAGKMNAGRGQRVSLLCAFVMDARREAIMYSWSRDIWLFVLGTDTTNGLREKEHTRPARCLHLLQRFVCWTLVTLMTCLSEQIDLHVWKVIYF